MFTADWQLWFWIFMNKFIATFFLYVNFICLNDTYLPKLEFTWPMKDQGMAELVINFLRGMDKFLTWMQWAQPDHVLAGQELNVFRNKSQLIIPVMKCSFPSIFWCTSCHGDTMCNFPLWGLHQIVLISTLYNSATFELNLFFKILFLQFWRLFHLSAVSNTVYWDCAEAAY